MPIINFSIDSDEDQREQLAEIAKQLTWLMSGNVDSVNMREIAGFLVDLTELLHESGLVGMSAADPDNPDAVRFWSGSADKANAPYRVLQNGNLLATAAFISGLITGSTIIGSEIKTSESAFPRAEMSSIGKFFGAYQSADSYVKVVTDAFGSTPGFIFHNGAGVDALIYLFNNIVQALSISTPAGAADISISSGRDLSLSGDNVSAEGIWTFAQKIVANITGSATYADNAGRAAAADTMAPEGTISWFQVTKTGSNLSHLEIKNLSDLTQSTSFRTATDGEKLVWNEKWGDTTTATRSAVSEYMSVSQAISAGVFTKVQYNVEDFDHLSEYDNVANYRFTAQSAGIYDITACVAWDVTANVNRAILQVYKNGISYRVLSDNNIGNGRYNCSQGSLHVKLAANDYIEIFAYVENALNILVGSSQTYLTITRVA